MLVLPTFIIIEGYYKGGCKGYYMGYGLRSICWRSCRPPSSKIAEWCRLMGIFEITKIQFVRSSYYGPKTRLPVPLLDESN